MVEEVLKGAEKSGAEVEIIKLGDLNVKFCGGCLKCDETGKCHLEDDMAGILVKMAMADGFVLGTPDRFDNVSGLMKNFMDRTNPLCRDSSLKEKVVGLVAVGCSPRDSSRERTIKCLENFCCGSHAMRIVGSVTAYEDSGKAGEIDKKKDVLERCCQLGQRLVNSR
jgi:multimeric flavodoxin WrbA